MTGRSSQTCPRDRRTARGAAVDFVSALTRGVLACAFLAVTAPASQQAPEAASPALDPSHQWGQWRGPLATGVAPHADPPLHWSEDRNVRWKSALPGLGHSTPVVWGDHVYLTTARPVGEALEPILDDAPGSHDNLAVTHRHEFLVLAVSRATGAMAWLRTVNEALPYEGGHQTASLASASVATDGRRVIAFFGTYGLYGLDTGGGLVWVRDLGRMFSKHAHGEGASPVLFEDSVIVNWDHEAQSFLLVLDADTGETRWRIERDEVTSWATPVVVRQDGRTQVIVAGSRRVCGLDLADGSLIWECAGLSQNVCATPVAADGMVFTGSSYEKQAMLAIRLAGASGDLTRTDRVAWTRRRQTPYVPSPLLYDGALYFLGHYQNVLSRVEAATGEEPTGPFRLPGLRNVYASPVGASGRIYVTDLDGTTLVLRNDPGVEVLAVNRLDDSFSASAALVEDTLLLRGRQFLYCLGEVASEDPR